MSLTLYNSLTRQKEYFTPLDVNQVGMYVCGPTVYDRAHLGNARPVVIFDVLFRLLNYLYPKVVYVRNITDVDDKINKASYQQGIAISELTTKTIKAYHEDMAALKALPPTYEPLATAHIDQMIVMIQTLMHKGFAYEVEGHVLFKVSQYPAYGRLSGRNQDELIAGARVEVAPYKKSPGDFVLWKPSISDQPGWESPWGRGRPGWHIECSAMSAEYLGKFFDIHAGGIDLIFPHHENEIAQSCSAHGQNLMAKYWLHNGHLTVSGDKMSKSLGNFFTVHDLLQHHKGEVIRLALLMTHYRQPLDWKIKVLTQAKQTLDRWYSILAQIDQKNLPDVQLAEIYQPVLKALKDDLNTPQALSELHQLANQFYKTNELSEQIKIAGILKETAKFLGLLQESDPQNWQQSASRLLMTKDKIESLIEQRQQARLQRDFSKADAIRKELFDKGIQLEDKAEQTVWSNI